MQALNAKTFGDLSQPLLRMYRMTESSADMRLIPNAENTKYSTGIKRIHPSTVPSFISVERSFHGILRLSHLARALVVLAIRPEGRMMLKIVEFLSS